MSTRRSGPVPSGVPAPLRAGLLACVFLGAAAGLARAETLADAVALAYQTNPQLQAQRAQLRALNETYVQQRAGLGPRLSAEVDLTYEEVRETPFHVEGRSSSESLALSQPIFTGGRVATAIQAAEADVRAGRERLRQEEQDLLLRVVQAYMGVRRDQQVLEVARATVAVLNDQLEETRAKVEVKENTRTDLAQAEARLAAARIQVAGAESQLASTRAIYLSTVGQNPGALAPEPELEGLPPDADKAFGVAEITNPTLMAAKYAELASRARVSFARSQNMPNVNLRVQAGRSPSSFINTDKYQNSVQAQAVFSQPLFTSGLNSSTIRRAQELNTADRLSIDATRRAVIQGLSQQWSLLSGARLSLAADQANVAASETAFYGMRQEERFGLRSTIELLNAQQELTSAQIGLLRDRYNEYVARAAVLSFMGVLRVETLAPGARSYDPVPDFNRVKNKGALPIEHVVKLIDGAAAPPKRPPAAARETATPDQQTPLPPAPPPGASQPPLRSVTEIMDQTRQDAAAAPGEGPLPSAGAR